jgi:hypothetical protein
MSILVLIFGELVLLTLEQVPSRPENLSLCAKKFVDFSDVSLHHQDSLFNYPSSYQYNWIFEFLNDPILNCRTKNLSNFEKSYPALYSKVNKLDNFLKRNVDAQIDQLISLYEQELDTENKIDKLERKYGITLEEITAGQEVTVISKQDFEKLKQQLSDLYSNQKKIKEQRQNLEKKIEVQLNNAKPLYSVLSGPYKKVEKDWKTKWYWYQFYIFLIQALFAFPLFFILYRKYLSLLKRNNPNAIIFAFLTGVSGIFVIQVITSWFWDLFLLKAILWLRPVWEFIKNSAFFQAIAYYFVVLFSAVFFGGLVWFINSKVYNPKKIFYRRLKKKECPICKTPLDLAEDFCPNCGTQILRKCNFCGNKTYRHFKFCIHCGKELK